MPDTEQKEAKVFDTWVEYRILYKVPIKAFDEEQAGQFAEKEYANWPPDERFRVDDNFDNVDTVEESDDYEVGEEADDATDFATVQR